MSDTNDRKDAALDFLRLTASGQTDQAFERYAAPHFRHHNPYFPGDAASLKAGMAANAARFPGMVFEPQRAIAEGDLVAVHSRACMQPGTPDIAVVHILRFEDGKIAEMWDIGQAAPLMVVNGNGLF
jgi:predicted SnoaL-like aldol condensation-catalyzing enzyme